MWSGREYLYAYRPKAPAKRAWTRLQRRVCGDALVVTRLQTACLPGHNKCERSPVLAPQTRRQF